MADLDLQTVLNSGDINSIFLGGTTSEDAAVKTSSLNTTNASVATNAANIATNTTDIAAIDTRVTTLENLPGFAYVKTTNHTVTGDTYEAISSYNATRDAGTYKINMSMIYALNSTTTSSYFRFSVDGGTTWTEVREEPKDNTDKKVLNYTFILVHAGGTLDIQTQGRKENAGDTLTVHALDIVVERKA